MNDYENIKNLEAESYKGLGSLNEDKIVATSDLSNAVSAICYNLSNMLDKRDENSIVSGSVEISGTLSALEDITTSSDIHAFRHGLVGKDVDFSTGGDEVLVVGHEHKIYGKESFIAGNEGNIIGAKAFHWKAIDTTNNLIYLTHEQTKFNSGSIPSSKITEITTANYVSQSDYKKYDIPYFGPRSESYYSDDNNASCLFKADDKISILKDDVYSGNPPKLVQQGAVGKTLILNNVQNAPYFRKLVVEDVLSGSVLSVSGLDTIEPLYQQTHYRKNKDHTYHGNYYFVCFSDVPDISTYTDGGWEKNMTFGCAALGENNCTIGYNSFATGKDNTTEGNYSIALGHSAKAGNNSVFAWSSGGAYNVSGEGQFGINPKSGISGFYIGDKSLAYYLKDLSGDLDGEIQNKLDKCYGGTVSGDVGVFQHDMKILSGNYIQTNAITEGVKNFSYKNSFLQAESVYEVEGKHSDWGIACTGSKGYCILSAYPALSAVKLSGDISMLASNTGKKYSWAFASGCDSESLEIKSVDTTTNIVTFKSALPADIANSKVSSETQMIEAFNKDDNALYCPSDPTIGNSVIHNFYANHAEGGSVKAIGKYTHAEGRRTIADNRYSHAEGDGSFAGRMAAHAEGQTTRAYGYYSHAEGRDTVVTNQATAAHAEGYNSKASESGAHAEGGYWLANNSPANFSGGLASGKGSHAEGNDTSAFGDASHAEGEKTTALCAASHAEGYSTYASSKYAHAEGVETIAQGGEGAHAEGNLTKATGTTSHAEGIKTVASGFASHAEGYQTSATISAAHAEGYLTYAKGEYSHAEGNQTSAIGKYSHAQGEKTKAQRDNAHAAGYMCEANAWNSTAIGRYSRVLSTDNNAFVWQGQHETTNPSFYESKGIGTFCINPKDSALSNVWIGSRNLSDIIGTEIDSAQSHADSAVNQLKSQISSALSTITTNPLSSLTYSSDIDKVISAAVEMRNILSSLYDAMRG